MKDGNNILRLFLFLSFFSSQFPINAKIKLLVIKSGGCSLFFFFFFSGQKEREGTSRNAVRKLILRRDVT